MTDTVDAEAPYGRKADGTPKAKPGPKRSGSQSSGPRAPGSRPASKARGGTDYRPGILGLAQAVCLPLSFAAPADAAAIGSHAPGIAEALNELAKERPEVAAMLERILQVGPYGMLIAATVPMLVQLGHNHGLIPEPMAIQMGATPKRVILAQLKAQGEAFQRQQAAERAQDAEDAAEALRIQQMMDAA